MLVPLLLSRAAVDGNKHLKAGKVLRNLWHHPWPPHAPRQALELHQQARAQRPHLPTGLQVGA